MHFPIIVIEEMRTDKKLFRKNLPSDDTLEQSADYYGEICAAKERKKVIKSDWLSKFFDGIATIDTKEEIITFLDADKIKSTLKEYFIKTSEELHDLALNGKLDVWEFRIASKKYKNCSAMFYFNGCGWTSLEFVDEAQYYAGQTFKIGNMFDAHC